LGVATIVENVPGSGANIGNDRVAKGPSDGSQILIARRASPPTNLRNGCSRQVVPMFPGVKWARTQEHDLL
jgi:tripartite-type tricarboxylate transporter receptor subunit TctC